MTNNVKIKDENKFERILASLTVGIPAIGFCFALWQLFTVGITQWEIILLVVMYFFTGIGVEVGMHRYFSHHSFKGKAITTIFLGVLGSMAAQGPILFWTAMHRKHHAFTDKIGDPHSPQLHGIDLKGRLIGLSYAHIGWLFQIRRQNWGQYVKDLLADRLVIKISGGYLLWILLGLAIPAFIGWLIGGNTDSAIRGLLWGGLVRIFILNNATWAINSIAHFKVMGKDDANSSRNVAWLALFTLGGGWHKNHHRYPALATTKLKPWQFDIGGGVIRVFELLGLVSDVKYPSESQKSSK